MSRVTPEVSSRAALANQLEQLKRYSRVVADTSDFQKLAEYQPEDATTNPSLVLKAAQLSGYEHLVQQAVAEQRADASSEGVRRALEALLVLFGVEILKVVPGRVSTETDASLSFDTGKLVEQGRRFIRLYERQRIPRERVLIKLATTWEGVRAAEVLEREGIHCNMTLLFCLPQAIASAQVGAKLISPFVGRILDWHKKKTGQDFAPEEDPGVESIRQIYAYFKEFSCPTEIMGASFRSKAEVLELAGCDLLTISPELLAELKESTDPVERKLSPEGVRENPRALGSIDESGFRWALNQDAMATELLASGIRSFHSDAEKLKNLLRETMGQKEGRSFAA
jgi:transaldolase